MRRNATMVIACIAFLALGLVTASPGPALAELAARTGSSLATLGGLYSAIFCGSLIAISVAGVLSDRFGLVPVLLAGTLVAGLGTVGYTLMGSLPTMLALALVTGMGNGAVDLAITVLIARTYADRSISALNLLNVFFGLGAMAGPAVAGLTIGLGYTSRSGLWLGGGLMLVAALTLPLLPRSQASTAAQTARVSGSAGHGPIGSVLRSAMVWALGCLLLLYVGVESGLGGWATAYLTQTTALNTAVGALVTAGFWMALTVGRMVATVLGSQLPPVRLLKLFLTTSAVGAALLVLSTGSAALSVVAILLLGLSFGPVFPTAVGVVAGAFPQAPGTASSLVVALGSIGGMLLPPAQGRLLEGPGPRASMLLVAASVAGMLVMLHLSVRVAKPVEQ